jgi:hypothetical protein
MIWVIIVGIILILMVLSYNKNNVVVNESSETLINKRNEYFKKYNILNNYETIHCYSINNEYINESVYIWADNESLYVLSDNYNNIENRKITIPIGIKLNNIVFYAMEGDYRIDNIVEGGGISLSGAIIGGMVAGSVGAILAGRKKINTNQKVTDERKICLYYTENNEDVECIVLDKGAKYSLEKLIPKKDINYIEKVEKIKNMM